MEAGVNKITINVNGSINGVFADDDKKSAAAERKTLFAGDLGIGPAAKRAEENGENPLIEQKKALAAKQAKKIIGDAWEKDSKAADSIDEMSKLHAEKVDELVAARNELKDIREQKEALEDVEDEKEKQTRLIELTKQEAYAKAEVKKGENATKALSQAITDAETDRLKQHDMVDAQGDAEKIMEAANKEIIGMIVDDAKDKIDEDTEETKEKAEERAKKEEELKERIENARENRREQEEMIENAANASEIDSDQRLAQTKAANVEEAQKDIQAILKEHGLLDEDLLGIDVDRKL